MTIRVGLIGRHTVQGAIWNCCFTECAAKGRRKQTRGRRKRQIIVRKFRECLKIRGSDIDQSIVRGYMRIVKWVDIVQSFGRSDHWGLVDSQLYLVHTHIQAGIGLHAKRIEHCGLCPATLSTRHLGRWERASRCSGSSVGLCNGPWIWFVTSSIRPGGQVELSQ